MSEGQMCLCVFLSVNACMLFGIQIVVFNLFLICLLGDRCEHGCYHSNLLPTFPYCELRRLPVGYVQMTP